MREVNIRRTPLHHSEKFTTSGRILPFAKPRTQPFAIETDAMKRASFFIVEIKNAT